MRKIRVLQINKLYYPEVGGIERIVQYLAEGLKDKTDMRVLVCQPKGRGARDVVHGVPVTRCGSFGTLFSLPISVSFLWSLRRMAREADILQFHAPFPLGDLGALLAGYRGKMALYWHSDVVKQKRLMHLYRPIMERFLKRVDVIIVSARGNIEGSSYLKPYRHKCVVVPFAVSRETEERGKAYLTHAEPNSGTKLSFLFVGRLVYYKGVDVLLKAFETVKEGELTIIGAGELEESLKAYAKERGMETRVHFLGRVTDEELYRQIERCDVFVLPSVMKSEAFGLVQQEAMAFGKPVINTRLASGVPEVSLDGLTGLTVEPGDAAALANAMEWMAEHPGERIRMGQAARERVEKEYTMDVMMERMIGIYQKLVEDERR